MNVSIINTEPSDTNTLGLKVLVLLTTDEVGGQPKEYDTTYQSLVLDATSKLRYILNYIERLNRASEGFSTPNTLLHELVTLQKPLDSIFTKINYYKGIVSGICDNRTVCLDLNDHDFCDTITQLRTSHDMSSKGILHVHYTSGYELNDRAKEFISSHNREIGDAIYNAYKKFKHGPFHNGYTFADIDKLYRIYYDTRPWKRDTSDIWFTNMTNNKTVCIGGLTLSRISTILHGECDTVDDIAFRDYMSESLNNLNLYVFSITELCQMIENIAKLHDGHSIGISAKSSDINHSIYEDIPFDQMYPDKVKPVLNPVDHPEDFKPLEHGKIPVKTLRYLLVYLMDLRLDVFDHIPVSHVLPIRIYKNDEGLLCATFNYNPNKDKDNKFHILYSYIYREIDIQDIMSYYNEDELAEYITYCEGFEKSLEIRLEYDVDTMIDVMGEVTI